MNSVENVQIDIFRGQLFLLAKGVYGEVVDPVLDCARVVSTLTGSHLSSIQPYCILRHLVGTVLNVITSSPDIAYRFRPSVEELILRLPFAQDGLPNDEWFIEQINQWWSQLRCICHARGISSALIADDVDPLVAIEFDRYYVMDAPFSCSIAA